MRIKYLLTVSERAKNRQTNSFYSKLATTESHFQQLYTAIAGFLIRDNDDYVSDDRNKNPFDKEFFDKIAEVFGKLKFKYHLAFSAKFDIEKLDNDVVIPCFVSRMQQLLTV